jgi:hypothetical protein
MPRFAARGGSHDGREPTGPAISQDQRWALTARLLHDTALDPTDRVAGCLLLLYGQPLSRIAAMTTSQVTRRDDQTFPAARPSRRAGPRPARQRRPPADQRRTQLPGSRIPARYHLAVPGHLPGRPITPARLGERLRAIGIYAQTGCRAALLDLAAQLPRRGPGRPSWPAREDRRQMDAPGRRRLVPLCSRASPPSSPALTNTSPTPALNQRYSAWFVIRSLPVSAILASRQPRPTPDTKTTAEEERPWQPTSALASPRWPPHWPPSQAKIIRWRSARFPAERQFQARPYDAISKRRMTHVRDR